MPDLSSGIRPHVSQHIDGYLQLCPFNVEHHWNLSPYSQPNNTDMLHVYKLEISHTTQSPTHIQQENYVGTLGEKNLQGRFPFKLMV